MPSFKYEDGVQQFTNSTGAKLLSGDIVLLPDGKAGIVEGLAGVNNGSIGMVRTKGIVTVDKASATVIAAGNRIQIATATKLATPKVGAADGGNILMGRAVAAAGNGTLTVDVSLNDQGPTI
jgi:predicted RecA/RadA family phage recombinase